jgi:hypothetical protein
MSIRSITTYDENQEKITISSKAIFIPVEFLLPEEVKESMPLLTVKTIEGNKVLRFYTPANKGDVIIWQGHEWQVIGYRHYPQKKGSKNSDTLPNIMTEYIGEISSETEAQS